MTTWPINHKPIVSVSWRAVLLAGLLWAAIGGMIAFTAGCAPQASAPITTARPLPPPSQNEAVAKGIAAAEQSLTLALQAAKVYTDLPRCRMPRVERICSDPEIVLEIRRGAIKAHNALMDARQNTALIDGALQAINLFRAVIPQT